MSTKYVRGEDTPMFPHHASPSTGVSGKKIMFLAGGGIVLFLLVVLLVVLFSKKEAPHQQPVVPAVSPTPTPTPTNMPPPSATPSPSPEPKRITINGVDVRDFMTEHPETMPNGAYLLERTDDFQIVFDPEANLFLITILHPNFVLTRARAEERFLTILEIGKDTVCSLDIEIGTPASVNKTYAGIVFGLTPCE